MIKALGKRVVIRPDEKSDTNNFGFKIPEKGIKKVQKGTVVSFGEEVALITSIEEGSRVTFGEHSGIAVTDDDANSYIVMNYSDILAKL